jgi:hypothetical protein
MDINVRNFNPITYTVLDSDNNTITQLTFDSSTSIISNLLIDVDQGKPYFLIIKDSQGNNLTNVFYRTENILESMPISFWLGEEYQNSYNEYLAVFEEAYKILLNFTRNGKEIQTGGVTINRVNRAVAYGGWGRFTYGIHQWYEFPMIKQKAYLPGNKATYVHPTYGTMIMSAQGALSTRMHELAHAVLVETCGNDPFPQEGIACFFEIELFRLLEYTQEYIADSATISVGHFNNYVGENLTNAAPEFMNAYNHVFPGSWIAAYILEDLVGFGEFENQIWITPTNYLPDFGWDFLKDYFQYSTTLNAPPEYNLNERLLYFIELASKTSLKEDFINFGFNITSNYDQSPPSPSPPEYTLNIALSGNGTTTPNVGTRSFSEGTSVVVTATASPGWSFNHWLLDSTNIGSSNPYSITMNDDHSLIAVFSEDPPPSINHELTLFITGSGSTSPSAGTHSYTEGSIVSITAIADEDWSFSHWLLDSTNAGSTNPYSITMNNDYSLTAVFTENPPMMVNNDINVVVGETTYLVKISSNSDISNFQFNPPPQNSLSFSVEGETGTTGICNITIPSEMMSGDFQVIINENLLTLGTDYNITTYESHNEILINYMHSLHTITVSATTVIPELNSIIILPLIGLISMILLLFHKKIRTNKKLS